MSNKINDIRKKKQYPPPEIYFDIYVDYWICPICYEKTTESDILHPNDITKKLYIHKECWEFIRSHWSCRSCKTYFPRTELIYRLPESGDLCLQCYEKKIEELKRNRDLFEKHGYKGKVKTIDKFLKENELSNK